jgi:hypothetical protein
MKRLMHCTNFEKSIVPTSMELAPRRTAPFMCPGSRYKREHGRSLNHPNRRHLNNRHLDG